MKEVKTILIVLTLLFLITNTSAIVINEFTTDPETDWDQSGSATSSDEWIELYNPSNQTIDLTNWTLELLDGSTNETEILEGEIQPNEYFIILNPEGSQNNDGQIILYNIQNQIIDSVSHGDWNDGNESDNAPEGGSESYADECITRIPNGQDTDQDNIDFTKTECTYTMENKIISPTEQNTIVTIGGTVIFHVFPRLLDFGVLQPGTENNTALNGPVIFDTNGSTTEVSVEITNVTGEPFETGLKIDGKPAKENFWTILQSNPIIEAIPTLDIPEDIEIGEKEGTITYTVTGTPPQ